ncbi:MAG TPA: S8 family serine peptidase [Polyangiaceae bacterium]
MSRHSHSFFGSTSLSPFSRVTLRASLIALTAGALGCSEAAPEVPAPHAAAQASTALDVAKRVIPNKSHAAAWIPSNVADARLVVKFQEGTGVRLQGAALSRVASLASTGIQAAQVLRDLGSISSLLSNRAVTLNPLFSLPETRLAALKTKGEQRARRKLAELPLYFTAPVPKSSRAELVALVEALNAHASVEIAYVQSKPELASAPQGAETFDANTPDFTSLQGYIDNDENGMGVAVARALPGGRGQNARVIDVEQHWVADHEDLPPPFFYAPAPYQGNADHGTAVAGVIVGQENGFGVTGLAPLSGIGYSSWLNAGVASAIATAAAELSAGDAVLIEVHAQGPSTATCSCNPGQCNYVAMEFFQAEFDAIQTATANGIMVVEAAGNGSVNLDHPTYAGAFDRTVRDSGAVLVGASLSTSRSPTCWTNYGSRIDVHAWGENVVTSGGDGQLYSGTLGERDRYTASFAGTSSASAIMSGAMAVLQSVAEQASGPLTALQARNLLASTGKPQEADLARRIGPLPDLATAAPAVTNPGSCGDGACGGTESCESCPADCGTCQSCVPAGCENAAHVGIPYTRDGAATACVFFDATSSFINSWNMAAVEINGVSITNQWVSASRYPEACDGGYYLRSVGHFAWSHVEVR